MSSNGSSRYQEERVRVAIIGVGNCASSFVQGVQYYRDADPAESVPGLMHVDLGGYHVRDIEFTAAFDIDAEKVGKDLSEAIFAGQNNTLNFAGEVEPLGVPVMRGMTHDGLGKYLSEKITKAPGSTVDIERRDESDVADVVAAEVDVHQAGDPGRRIRVAVVLDALHERRGTVADADDGHPYLMVACGRFAGHVSPGFSFVGSVRIVRSFAARSCWISSLSQRTSRSLVSSPSWCSSRV